MQLSLPFDAPSPERKRPITHRLFFALLLEASAAEEVEARYRSLQREHELRGSRVQQERFHLSLGEVYHEQQPPPLEFVAHHELLAQRVGFPPFTVTLSRALRFAGARGPLVLTGDARELERLHAFEHTLAQALGVRSSRVFTPHVTLLYTEQPFAEQTIPPVTWTIREFALVHSFVGASRYEIAGRWPLCG